MSRWWRAYSDALTDPKLQSLRPATFKCWFNLLCIAAKNEGRIPPVSALTSLCQSDVRHLTAHCEALVQARLIELTAYGFTPHNWQKRQYKSDVSTPRVKRFRNVSSAVSETAPDTEQNRTEKKKKHIGTALPENWTLSEEDTAYALKKGWASDRVLSEAERFKLYHLDNGKPHKDWHLAWCKWVTSPYQSNGAGNGSGRTVQQAARELHENVVARMADVSPSFARSLDPPGNNLVRLLPKG